MNSKDMLSFITQFLCKKLYLPKGSLVYKYIPINTGLIKGSLTIENGKALIERYGEFEELKDSEDIGRVFIFLRENFPEFGAICSNKADTLKIYKILIHTDSDVYFRNVIAYNADEAKSLMCAHLDGVCDYGIESIEEITELSKATPRLL